MDGCFEGVRKGTRRAAKLAEPDAGLAFASPGWINLANNHGVRCHRKQPVSRQHRLKSEARATRARIVASELLDQFLVTMHKAQATLYVRFGRIALAALRSALESRAGRMGRD